MINIVYIYKMEKNDHSNVKIAVKCRRSEIHDMTTYLYKAQVFEPVFCENRAFEFVCVIPELFELCCTVRALRAHHL